MIRLLEYIIVYFENTKANETIRLLDEIKRGRSSKEITR